MLEIVLRFVIGGVVVSIFSVIGDLLKPKSFAGLFGAAPSVALATLGLTVAKQGGSYAGIEGRSMIGGAIAFFAYASVVSRIMMRYNVKAVWTTLGMMPVWLGAAFALWYVWLR